MTLLVPFLPKKLFSDYIFVPDDVSLFVHYHDYDIIHNTRNNNFENNYNHFGVIY